jgi:hypothetical protein
MFTSYLANGLPGGHGFSRAARALSFSVIPRGFSPEESRFVFNQNQDPSLALGRKAPSRFVRDDNSGPGGLSARLKPRPFKTIYEQSSFGEIKR